MSAAIASVLSELDGIFTLIEQHKNSTERFSKWKHCLALRLILARLLVNTSG